METENYRNRLADSDSPYLRQHAHNPVDWYPWGAEALAKAKTEDKPILLSIGYSACHWCHVMAHESFENPEIAELMNRYFVNIKVDREERPDLDAIYMDALQKMTGSGGWPMTLFLTPEGKPFYGGTYFPPKRHGQIAAFSELLKSLAAAWQEQRSEAEAVARRVEASLKRSDNAFDTEDNLEAMLGEARKRMIDYVDFREGGFGLAPKFPQAPALDFVLQQAALLQGSFLGRQYEDALRLSLSKMGNGGIFDQLAGGFHRYSTDGQWLIPHFEKMLYDNALLARTYLNAWRAFGDEAYRLIAERTLDFMARELLSPDGAFYSSLDADSDGIEGQFYVWTPAQIWEELGEKEGRAFAEAFGVSEAGNFKESGQAWSVLHLRDDAFVPGKWDGAIAKLLKAREKRVRPGRDEKILAEWNGLALQAFAEAAFALDREDYLEIAVNCAEFLLKKASWKEKNGLRRVRRAVNGKENSGYLEDYASLGLGFLLLYQVHFDAKWLKYARELAESILALFSDSEEAGFFQTAKDAELLIAQRKDTADNVIPSGNSMASMLLAKLGLIGEKMEWLELVARQLKRLGREPATFPSSYGWALCLIQEELISPLEIKFNGTMQNTITEEAIALLRRRYIPGAVYLQETGKGKAEVSLCSDGICYPPSKNPAGFREQTEDVILKRAKKALGKG